MSEQTVREDLDKRMKDVNLENLQEFIDYAISQGKGYGEICIAIGACAAATAKAIDRSPSGGITGFMAGAVFWEFTRFWGIFTPDAPLKVIDYSNMLYPQYDDKFAKTITPDTWKWLQGQARKKLGDTNAGMVHSAVEQHWINIVNGHVPFGYTLSED